MASGKESGLAADSRRGRSPARPQKSQAAKRSGRRRKPASAPSIATRPLWTCPECGNRFVTRNNWHSCGRWPLSHHFKGRPKLAALWRAFVAAVRENGPVRVVSSKTRLVLMVRVRFAGVTVRSDHLRASFWLMAPRPGPQFRIEEVVPGYWMHTFELRDASDLDAEVRKRLREAYGNGEQRHLIDRKRRGLGRRRVRTS